MGLFDKVSKKGLGGVFGSKVTDALEQVTGLDLDGDGQAGGTDVFGAPRQTSPVPGQFEEYQENASSDSLLGRKETIWPGQTAHASHTHPYFIKIQVTDKEYFGNIILAYFLPDYEIDVDVPTEKFGGEGSAYDFALYSNGICAGVIMLANKNSPKNKAYQDARATAESAGVPFINFYTHMPNVEEFVVERIRRMVKKYA